MCGPSGARGLLRGASSAAQLTAKDEVDLKVAGNPGALESTEYSEVTLLTGSDKRYAIMDNGLSIRRGRAKYCPYNLYRLACRSGPHAEVFQLCLPGLLTIISLVKKFLYFMSTWDQRLRKMRVREAEVHQIVILSTIGANY